MEKRPDLYALGVEHCVLIIAKTRKEVVAKVDAQFQEVISETYLVIENQLTDYLKTLDKDNTPKKSEE